MSQYVMVEDPIACMLKAVEASKVENQAMQDDREGHLQEAIEGYRRAAKILEDAIDVCPSGHPDASVLARHADEVLQRASYLEDLDGLPDRNLEEFIHVAELTIGMAKMPPRSPEDTENEWSLHEGAKVMGAAAVVSGTAGLLALGPFTGIALGAATAYATTREDQAGSAARRVGVLGVQLVHTAKAINREHSIGQRVLSATAQTQQVLYTFNERHRVTDKLNRGLSAAGLALSSFVSKATR